MLRHRSRAWAVLALAPLLMAAGGESDAIRFLAVLGVMLIAGKFSGELFERLGQPAVLGELIAGVLLGGSLLGVIPVAPDDALTEVFTVLAEVGVVILLFEIGLESDLKAMFRVGPTATAVAVVGVIVPFVLGFLYWMSPIHPIEHSTADRLTTAIFVGATLTATSVGITARVLTDLQALHTLEARLIIGAAVIDDIMGLVILAVVSGLTAGVALSLLGIAKIIAVAVGFLVLAIVVGLKTAPRIFGVVDQMRVRGILLVVAFSFALLLAALAAAVGSAAIIGAFAAGIILSGTNQFEAIEERIKPVADVFTPIFFLSIGAAVDLSLLNPFNAENLPIITIGVALLVIAVIGKLVSGWAAPTKKFNRVAVGVGMAPRGEVGLVFASIGRNAGVLSPEVFNGVMLMVIGSTFAAPPLLKIAFARWGRTDPGGDPERDEAPEAELT